MKKMIIFLSLILLPNSAFTDIINLDDKDLPRFTDVVKITFSTLKVGQDEFELVTSIKNISNADIKLGAETLHLNSPLEWNLLTFYEYPPDFTSERLEITKESLDFIQPAVQPSTSVSSQKYPLLTLPPSETIFIRQPLKQYYELDLEKQYYFVSYLDYWLNDSMNVWSSYGVKLQLSQSNKTDYLPNLHLLESEILTVFVTEKGKDALVWNSGKYNEN